MCVCVLATWTKEGKGRDPGNAATAVPITRVVCGTLKRGGVWNSLETALLNGTVTAPVSN